MPKLTCIFNGRALAVHHVADGKFVIGRGADCEIQVDSLAIALHHAELLIKGENCQVSSIDPDFPIYVNGNLVEAPLDLNHEDLLLIGKHNFRFSMDGIALGVRVPDEAVELEQSKIQNNESPKKIGYLQVQNGENIGRVFPLSQTIFKLGAKGQGYAMIARRFDGYYISFLEGKHVTVNGQAVADESILLQNEDIIALGATTFQFYL